MAKMEKVSFSYSTCKFSYHPHSIVVCFFGVALAKDAVYLLSMNG